MSPEGVAVGAALLPVLVGGVIGAGVGTMLLYGGAIEAGEAENIFAEEGGETKAAAHSAYESLKQDTGAKVTAASAYERRKGLSRGFAAMFL
ncbi:hypothetical protein VOLCADRAFT_121022 [Volvox carteri f. nagariensis]|uniref:Uncharacterized protein n=1 Tax=Volvox carteri f. nagariensis TaxID=3068 RepID=D8TZJ1_VOLCA|nr:uncharacterized protein VOLCADRAFT_121022 [Volvox carteri f. nagariensis]EFJ47283.1 hypothetical protein VOLCADRAFT_121022 [Volvox carteri f. nagariensis]|eukprot:XP_002951832.1 hypothetical protein VOLCADRAFT_121022 [Volvox carteri f. nagariensis]